MKNSPLTTILLVLAVIAAPSATGLCYIYISTTRELRDSQAKVAQINNSRMLINSLVGDLVEYSKKNPAIDPILESAGIKPKAGAAAATK
jgi:hypothetical protein